VSILYIVFYRIDSNYWHEDNKTSWRTG